MFRILDNVPEVYAKQSRDFQTLAVLYDLAFQQVRFNIDSLTSVSSTKECQESVLPLIARKVGFFTDTETSTRLYRCILDAFPYIIRYKGSLYGVKLALNLFSRLLNIPLDVRAGKTVEVGGNLVTDLNYVTVTTKTPFAESAILYDLLQYVRPTGLELFFTVKTDDVEDDDIFNVEGSVQVETTVNKAVVSNATTISSDTQIYEDTEEEI